MFEVAPAGGVCTGPNVDITGDSSIWILNTPYTLTAEYEKGDTGSDLDEDKATYTWKWACSSSTHPTTASLVIDSCAGKSECVVRFLQGIPEYSQPGANCLIVVEVNPNVEDSAGVVVGELKVNIDS